MRGRICSCTLFLWVIEAFFGFLEKLNLLIPPEVIDTPPHNNSIVRSQFIKLVFLHSRLICHYYLYYSYSVVLYLFYGFTIPIEHIYLDVLFSQQVHCQSSISTCYVYCSSSTMIFQFPQEFFQQLNRFSMIVLQSLFLIIISPSLNSYCSTYLVTAF